MLGFGNALDVFDCILGARRRRTLTNQGEDLGPLFASQADNEPSVKKLPRPPSLRLICSLSVAMRAEEFFRRLRENRVTMLIDTRISTEYDGVGFADGRDLPYLAHLHGIGYYYAAVLAPTQDMRKNLARDFKKIKYAKDRDPMAWTRFLEEYERLMRDRRPIRHQDLWEIIHGEHEAIAILCFCHCHNDCHRSFTCGMLVRCFDGLELRILERTGLKPENPRKYRLHDFAEAGLKANAPARRMRNEH